MANPERQILYLSHAYTGSSHDYAMLKNEFDPLEALWFEAHHVKVHLGFLGLAKDYNSQKLSIPYKRKPKKQLTQQQKNHNRQISSTRVRVEHSIGGLKRYRFLSDRLRCRSIPLYNQVAGVCAGLWNYHLSC